MSQEALIDALSGTIETAPNGATIYRNAEGRYHRTDGPAVVRVDGTLAWFQNNQLHRTVGPAVVWPDHVNEWWFKGVRHRIDGPAVEYADGGKEWWINGKSYTQQEYQAQL